VPALSGLVLQYARFGAVGVIATVTHVLMFTTGIELAGLAPLAANFAAFGIAVLVSFLGHLHWTFGGQIASHQRQQQRAALARFIVVALTGLALNSLVVYLVVHLMGLPYQYAIVLMISVVPLLIFVFLKLWVFHP
jgi:putative flippase GtrA